MCANAGQDLGSQLGTARKSTRCLAGALQPQDTIRPPICLSAARQCVSFTAHAACGSSQAPLISNSYRGRPYIRPWASASPPWRPTRPSADCNLPILPAPKHQRGAVKSEHVIMPSVTSHVLHLHLGKGRPKAAASAIRCATKALHSQALQQLSLGPTTTPAATSVLAGATTKSKNKLPVDDEACRTQGYMHGTWQETEGLLARDAGMLLMFGP